MVSGEAFDYSTFQLRSNSSQLRRKWCGLCGEKTVLILDLEMRAKNDTPNKKHDHPGI